MIVYRLSPKDLNSIYQAFKLGAFRVSWEHDGRIERPLEIRFKEIQLLRATTITKSISKKDINVVKIKFEKKLGFDFGEIDVSVLENEMKNIKIINLNRTVSSHLRRKYALPRSPRKPLSSASWL